MVIRRHDNRRLYRKLVFLIFPVGDIIPPCLELTQVSRYH